MNQVKNVLYKLIEEKKIAPADAMKVFKELKDNEGIQDEDIAVIGMALRLPKANNLEEFWNNLIGGVNCISKLDDRRKQDIETLLTEEERAKVLYHSGGYLDDIDKFDAPFFRIPPKEVLLMEPEQRLFLEVAWEAIEDAGYASLINGTETGVYVGHDNITASIYQKYTGGMENGDTLALTGIYPSILSSRLSYILNLRGPSIVLDTACSSGLVAVYEAIKALKNKECSMAIAGGICLQLWPVIFDSFKMIETKDKLVRTYDKKSSGTVWGEGIALYVLKPISKALEDGDHIHAVIKGSAINNDGVSSGITAPNAQAQEQVILKAWKDAKINAESISYVESHGTGTIMGDPIEYKALSNAFAKYTNRKQFCGIGSLKPSIGHLVSASGTASLAKVILSLQNKKIPATINFTEPNPYINFCNSPLYLTDRLMEWEKGDTPRRAGVSCFGFSGTNCHMVVEEAPEPFQSEDINEPLVMVLSAKSKNALVELAKRYCTFLEKHATVSLVDTCYTASTGRCHMEHRLAVAVENVSELKEKLNYFIENNEYSMGKNGIWYQSHKIVSRKTEEKTGVYTEIEKLDLTRKANKEIADKLKICNCISSIIYTICQYYTTGMDIDWIQVYRGQSRNRISLPVYPFEEKRYWYQVEEKKEQVNKMKQEKFHDLLGYRISDTMEHITFVNQFSEESNWVLREHRLLEKSIMPGTAYIEMMKKACEIIFGKKEIEVTNCIFYSPFIADSKEKDVYTVVKKNKDELIFTFCSKVDEDWVKHAEMTVTTLSESANKYCEISSLINSFGSGRVLDYVKQKTLIADFGPRWKNLNRVLIKDNSMLAKVQIPNGYEADMELYDYHPALLDSSVNVAIRINDYNEYLPFLYRGIKFYDSMPNEYYCYIKEKVNASENAETKTYDIQLIGVDGKVFAEISDYIIKKVKNINVLMGKEEMYYKTEWVKVEEKMEETSREPSATLIFESISSRKSQLASELRAKGCDVVEVREGEEFREVSADNYVMRETFEDYNRIIKIAKERKIKRIVHVKTLHDRECENDIEQAQKYGLDSLFLLTRAISEQRYVGGLELVVITQCAYEVTGKEEEIIPQNAAIWGMAKVIEQENPNIHVSCIDVEKHISAETLTEEIMIRKNQKLLAIRTSNNKEQRYSEYFNQVEISKIDSTPVTFESHGAYVITGGISGVGLEIAKYLASQEKLNLCLISRTALPQREQWEQILKDNEHKKVCLAIEAICEIEKMGTSISTYAADVTDENALADILNNIRSQHGKLNGVIHCAGVPGGGFIIRKNMDDFHKVLYPKMQGTFNLDKLTEKDKLDFFVMFSSIIAIMGSPGQADYAAANSYMESFASYRRRKGKKTLTISWAPWEKTGMTENETTEHLNFAFCPIAIADAVNAFRAVLEWNVEHVVTGEIEYDRFYSIKEGLLIGVADELEQLIQKKRVKSSSCSEPEQETKENVLLKGRDDGHYSEHEMKLAAIWGSVMGVSDIDIYDSFMQLGGDSIVATNIFTAISKEYGSIIDVADVFTYPTIYQMGEYIDKTLNIKTNKYVTIADIMTGLANGKITTDEAHELKKTLKMK